MKPLETLASFADPDLVSVLGRLDDQALNELTFGVVEMDMSMTVLRYNAAESRASGLPPERVLGRQFFKQVAPCSNNALVAGRFGHDGLDATFPYTFALRMKPVPVTLRLLECHAAQRCWLLVNWHG
jgi:photoactive yellow protein